METPADKLYEIPKEVFDRVWEMVKEIGDREKHFTDALLLLGFLFIESDCKMAVFQAG